MIHASNRPASPRRIGLVVDHPLRDLDGLCLVAQLLTQRGHEAVLLPFYTQHFDLPNLDLDMLVLNYVRPANQRLVEAAAARGIALVVLDTEGGLIPEKGPTSPQGIARFLRSSGIDRQLALYLFWGERLRDHIVANTDLAPERALVTGCPRFDLARKRHRPASAGKGKVLVNTNFPVVNSAHAPGGQLDDAALRSVGYDDAEIAELALNVQSVMGRMIEAIRRLAGARPARKFVVRPHPFERTDPYLAAFADCPNIVVERRGSALKALEDADCLLHVNCTTAIDASLCGVPPISLNFINEKRLASMAKLPTRISHSAGSLPQALTLIDRAGKLPAQLAPDEITPFFGPLDGYAAERVAEALATADIGAAALAQTPGVSPARSHRSLAAFLGRSLGSSMIEGLRCRLRPDRAVKNFSLREVRNTIALLALSEGGNAAKVEHSRSALGLPSMALKLGPP